MVVWYSWSPATLLWMKPKEMYVHISMVSLTDGIIQYCFQVQIFSTFTPLAWIVSQECDQDHCATTWRRVLLCLWSERCPAWSRRKATSGSVHWMEVSHLSANLGATNAEAGNTQCRTERKLLSTRQTPHSIHGESSEGGISEELWLSHKNVNSEWWTSSTALKRYVGLLVYYSRNLMR